MWKQVEVIHKYLPQEWSQLVASKGQQAQVHNVSLEPQEPAHTRQACLFAIARNSLINLEGWIHLIFVIKYETPNSYLMGCIGR